VKLKRFVLELLLLFGNDSAAAWGTEICNKTMSEINILFPAET
jgi:hypothetical protein